MKIDLAGKPIVITGASEGLGLACARAFAAAGMPVVLAARSVDKLEASAENIRAMGGQALAVPTDVTDVAACERLIAAATDAFGAPYAVLANAGYLVDAPVLDVDDTAVRAAFDVNVFGSLNVIRPAVEAMRTRTGNPRGHVLVMSSCVGRLTQPHLGVYAATKASQAMMAGAMRAELKAEHIAVSSIHPLGVRTKFFDHAVRRGAAEEAPHRAPSSFMQSPEHVAECVVRCVRSPKAEVWTGPRGALARFGAALFTMFPRFAAMTMRVPE